MNERPTPIVDSSEFTVPIAGKVIASKTARGLERERDEAREWSRELANVCDDLRAELADLRRSQDGFIDSQTQGGREMNDQEINIAIAEACGWEWRVGIYQNCRGLFHSDDPYLKGHECNQEQLGNLPVSSDCSKRVPDYCNDLNAMHEAEKMLNAGQINTYLGFLYLNAKTASANSAPWEIIAARVGVHATARQRAEAFIRTIGKWEEAK